jgi:hypothetical protein
VLSTPWAYFLDHFAEDEKFIRMGQRYQDTFVESVLLQIVQQMYPDCTDLSGLILTRLAEHKFIHGAFFSNGHVGGIFYFEEVNTGLVMVDSKFARFTAQLVQVPDDPSRN